MEVMQQARLANPVVICFAKVDDDDCSLTRVTTGADYKLAEFIVEVYAKDGSVAYKMNNSLEDAICWMTRHLDRAGLVKALPVLAKALEE